MVLRSALDVITLIVMVASLLWMHAMDWMFRRGPDAQLVPPLHRPDESATPTQRTTRPVIDQRPRIEGDFLPRNTFSF